MTRHTQRLPRMALLLTQGALLWMAISTVVFRFRHPWATGTEVFLHIPDAFMLRKVPYTEMRPRE